MRYVAQTSGVRACIAQEVRQSSCGAAPELRFSLCGFTLRSRPSLAALGLLEILMTGYNSAVISAPLGFERDEGRR